MSLRPLIALALLLLLSACVSYPDISQSRSPCRTEAGGWCSFMSEAAVDAYPFAIAATNAYTGDKDLFDDLGPELELLERLPIDEADLHKGFGYEVFAQYAPGSEDDPHRRPIARILAFRGTDFDGLADMFFGTLRDDQIEIALRYFSAERERTEFSDQVPWIVTGHSLGGALATEVSIAFPRTRAYMFNTSPFYRGDAMTNGLRRIVFNERGEFLRRFARYDTAPAADLFTVNCSPQNNAISKHSVRKLAECLTWIAAYRSETALAIVKANEVTKPMVECGPADKPHPGPSFQPFEPCVHQARRSSSR